MVFKFHVIFFDYFSERTFRSFKSDRQWEKFIDCSLTDSWRWTQALNDGVRIRPARTEEAQQLSELAYRSKAHWGYDDQFLARCRDPLTVSPGNIVEGRVFVLEDQGRVRGFYELTGEGPEKELTFLFVEPADIGRGYGRALWLHAVRTAKVRGADRILIHSDPHAEAFYRAMGAKRVGEVPSTAIPGRMLPLMCFDLRLPVSP